MDLDYLESFVDGDNFPVINDESSDGGETEIDDADDELIGIDDDQVHYEVQEVSDEFIPRPVISSHIHEILLHGASETKPLDMMSLEDSFCKNFTCCGLVLDDMHDLLAHYEECHVQIDVNSDGDDDWDNVSFVEVTTMCDIGKGYTPVAHFCPASAFEDEECISAFDDSVMVSRASASIAALDAGNPLIRRIGDVEDDLGVSMLEWIHDECERDGKRLKMMSEIMGVEPQCSSDEEVDVVTVELSMGNNSVTGKGESDSGPLDDDSKTEKPYRCTYPGCDKAYKNPNGLKYHNLHGHSKCENDDSDYASRLMKPYVCNYTQCYKRYKNLNGLKYHIEKAHGYSKGEANQMATEIVKKTNARYGINARSVPASVLFAAMKEHEDKERTGNEENVLSNNESLISNASVSVMPSLINVKRVPIANDASAMTPRNIQPSIPSPSNTVIATVLNTATPIQPNSQVKFCFPQTIIAKPNPENSLQSNVDVVAGIPPYIQALAASGFIDLNNYITAFKSLAANNGKFDFNNNSKESSNKH